MIIRFDLENFRSIKEKVSFSFETANIKDHVDNYVAFDELGNILTSSVIYGANASGKSNVLLGFLALQYLVNNSANLKPEEKIGPYEPFILDVNTREKPVSLEVEFIAENKIRYIYSVSYSKNEILKEELFHYPNSHRSLLFSRKSKTFNYGPKYKGERKSIEKKLLDNQLFLSKAVLDNVEILNPVFSFFNKKILNLSTYESYVHESGLKMYFAERLADPKDKEFSNKFNKFICALDTGIIKVISEEINWEMLDKEVNLPKEDKEIIRNNYKFVIKTEHKVYDGKNEIEKTYFDEELESKGTKSLFVLIGIIIDAVDRGTVLIVDEFENNLHPHLTKFIIKLFHNPVMNKNNAQLIFATHDISQLDNDIFRRDQIWFTEKDEYGTTSLYCLSDIKGVRKDVPYDKWYDTGRFGATPVINELELLFDNE